MRHAGQAEPIPARREPGEQRIPGAARQLKEGHGGVENEEVEGVPLGARQKCWSEAQRGWTPIRSFGETAHIPHILCRPVG
jgi:hypothetical protein